MSNYKINNIRINNHKQRFINELKYLTKDVNNNDNDIASKRIEKLKKKGSAYLKKGDYQKALSVYKELYKERPGDIASVYNLGLIYLSLNKYSKSIQFLGQIIDAEWEKKINTYCYYLYAKISVCDWTNYKKDVNDILFFMLVNGFHVIRPLPLVSSTLTV